MSLNNPSIYVENRFSNSGNPVFKFLLITTVFALLIGTSTGLRQDLGVYSWFPFIIVTLVITAASFTSNALLTSKVFILFLVFSIIVALHSPISSDPVNTFLRGIKFLFVALFIHALYFLPQKHRLLSYFIYVFLVVNGVALLLAWVGFGAIGAAGGGGRWWTIVNYPGGLYVPGIVYLAYLMFIDRIEKPVGKYFHYPFALLSVFFLFADGSRTGILILGVFLFLLFLRVSYFKKVISSIFLCLIAIFIVTLDSGSSYDGPAAFDRINETVAAESFAAADNARYKAIVEGIKYLNNNNFVFTGRGFSAIESNEANSFQQGIHNAYLQVLVELGLIGLIIFLSLLIYPAYVAFKNRSNTFGMFSLAMIVALQIKLLFHPISTEFGDWILYFLSFIALRIAIENRSSYSQ